MKPVLAKDKEDEKVVKKGKEEAIAEEKKAKLAVEASESQKRVENKVRNIDLQLDLEKPERDSGISNKLPQQGHKQPQPQPQPSKAVKDEPHGEKPGKLKCISGHSVQSLGIFLDLCIFVLFL